MCNVYTFHTIYSSREAVDRVNVECRKAEIGCVECKKLMAEGLIEGLAPIREKRRYYEQRPDEVEEGQLGLDDGELEAIQQEGLFVALKNFFGWLDQA